MKVKQWLNSLKMYPIRDNLPKDVIYSLYENKYKRIKGQLTYFETIEGISDYIRLNFKNRVS